MSTQATIHKGEPLSSIFEEPWDCFTVDRLDDITVEAVLKNAGPPPNAAHFPTKAGLIEAAKSFSSQNGDELLRALELLEGK